MIDTHEICWVAGLLEGEGCFYLNKRGHKPSYPFIQIRMTDKDVLDRAASLLGGRVKGPFSNGVNAKQNHTPVFTLRIYGYKAIQWMLTLYRLMGQRRRRSIAEILNAWRQGTILR